MNLTSWTVASLGLMVTGVLFYATAWSNYRHRSYDSASALYLCAMVMMSFAFIVQIVDALMVGFLGVPGYVLIGELVLGALAFFKWLGPAIVGTGRPHKESSQHPKVPQ